MDMTSNIGPHLFFTDFTNFGNIGQNSVQIQISNSTSLKTG
jgi:hypothetical protein